MSLWKLSSIVRHPHLPLHFSIPYKPVTVTLSRHFVRKNWQKCHPLVFMSVRCGKVRLTSVVCSCRLCFAIVIKWGEKIFCSITLLKDRCYSWSSSKKIWNSSSKLHLGMSSTTADRGWETCSWSWLWWWWIKFSTYASFYQHTKAHFSLWSLLWK